MSKLEAAKDLFDQFNVHDALFEPSEQTEPQPEPLELDKTLARNTLMAPKLAVNLEEECTKQALQSLQSK